MQLENTQLYYIQLTNPIQLLEKILDNVVINMNGQELWKKTKVISVAHQLALVCYTQEKNIVQLSDVTTKLQQNLQNIRDQIIFHRFLKTIWCITLMLSKLGSIIFPNIQTIFQVKTKSGQKRYVS
ncbi:Hypothetical_protein [Hexamita inflata]|uniref:Hypothetical_protein n=1 Tax=Hexamita inflata TaxID=28002 RepID=A0AA86NNP4_9EUKA|nr:Hypothetical protein HINF_LOCUS10056 [Hexamita inflata]